MTILYYSTEPIQSFPEFYMLTWDNMDSKYNPDMDALLFDAYQLFDEDAMRLIKRHTHHPIYHLKGNDLLLSSHKVEIRKDSFGAFRKYAIPAHPANSEQGSIESFMLVTLALVLIVALLVYIGPCLSQYLQSISSLPASSQVFTPEQVSGLCKAGFDMFCH